MIIFLVLYLHFLQQKYQFILYWKGVKVIFTLKSFGKCCCRQFLQHDSIFSKDHCPPQLLYIADRCSSALSCLASTGKAYISLQISAPFLQLCLHAFWPSSLLNSFQMGLISFQILRNTETCATEHACDALVRPCIESIFRLWSLRRPPSIPRGLGALLAFLHWTGVR